MSDNSYILSRKYTHTCTYMLKYATVSQKCNVLLINLVLGSQSFHLQNFSNNDLFTDAPHVDIQVVHWPTAAGLG